jgi:hypothetical protein
MSLNCSQNTGLLFIRQVIWRGMKELYIQGKNPDSSTRALWQFYQQSHLVEMRRIWRTKRCILLY